VDLERYTSSEGLVASSSLRWEGGHIRIVDSGEEVWMNPAVQSVAEVLIERDDLWRIAQLRVQAGFVIHGRAPIFGVPFDAALRQLLSIKPRQRHIKSMFQRVDAYTLESDRRGVVATLVAHLGFDVGTAGPEVSLEAWQIPNVEDKTFYLHAIFTVDKGCFTHFDGATMYHDLDSKQHLFQRGMKVKGYQKQKHFRLDGEIDIDDVRTLGTAFLPLEDLAAEYFLTKQESSDA
jgi:hypothetical protein